MRFCPQCGARFEQPLDRCPNDGALTFEIADAPKEQGDPLIGTTVDGRYRVERKVGEGGMGVVYLTTHVALNKKLALKVLRGDNSKDPEVVQRFMQEAQAATSAGHPNIIDISDFGRLPDGDVYFVMEFLDGLSLTDVIKEQGSIGTYDAIHIIRQIASALEAAHGCGIVHRDLKPDNVSIITQGKDARFVKVLDFGIAKVGGATSKLTKTGMIFGTPHYMSPEQAAGHAVDQRTDIYALGVIAYEMLTGKVPFDADTFMAILSKHMFEPPTPPSIVAGSGLGPLENVILRCLEKDQSTRYQSMAEVIEDLDTILRGGSVRGPASAEEAASVGGEGFDEDPAADYAMAPKKGLSPVVIGAAVGGLVLLMAIVGAAVAFSGDDEEVAHASDGSGEASGPATDGAGTEGAGTEGAGETPAAASPPATGEAPAAPATVSLSSDPPGAEVLINGAIVGNTPANFPRPAAAITATLRLGGYQEMSVQLSPESPASISVSLREEERVARAGAGGGGGGGGGGRARAGSGGSGGSAGASGGETTQRQQTRQTQRGGGRVTTSEVVDPWAD